MKILDLYNKKNVKLLDVVPSEVFIVFVEQI